MDLNEETELLALLADGEFRSGEWLAGRLGISRAAIWKRVGKLAERGIELERVSGRGYRVPGRHRAARSRAHRGRAAGAGAGAAVAARVAPGGGFDQCAGAGRLARGHARPRRRGVRRAADQRPRPPRAQLGEPLRAQHLLLVRVALRCRRRGAGRPEPGDRHGRGAGTRARWRARRDAQVAERPGGGRGEAGRRS